MSSDVSGTSGRPTNPIVTASAEQVAIKRRRTRSKAKDLPRWECRDQMTLFDPSTSEANR
ncbi:hypothetical protein [Nocardia gipuzkoensis]